MIMLFFNYWERNHSIKEKMKEIHQKIIHQSHSSKIITFMRNVIFCILVFLLKKLIKKKFIFIFILMQKLN